MTQKRIIVLAPPLAEKEFGFETWLLKILKLSTELSIPVILYGLRGTYDAVKSKMAHNKWKGTVSFHAFSDWDDLLVLTDFVNTDDLLILISARKKAVSYQKYLDHIPSKLEKHFHDNNKIVIYPQQNSQITEKNDEIESTQIYKETEHIDSVKRKFKRLFKRN